MQRTDLNISPFFDDYSSLKNYQKILFRPRPVQARELNQVQTILQEQVERMGRHLFEEGAMVIPGGNNFVSSQEGAEVNYVGGSRVQDVQNVVGLKLRSRNNGLVASVFWVIPASFNEPHSMFLEYEGTGTDGARRFTEGDACDAFYVDGGAEVQVANVDIVRPVFGQWFATLSGIYFVRGFMVRTDDQRVEISRNSTNGSYRVGFKVIESIIDETKDNTLYSNAYGTTNFKAPGASRLKIELMLVTKPEGAAADPDFIELAVVKRGELQKKVDYTQYGVLEKTLAQRTYEESGDYVVKPFALDVLNHLKTDTSKGLLTLAEGGREDLYSAQLRPGVAYVRGYRVENVGVQTLEVPKSRDTTFVNNAVGAIGYGSYIVVKNMLSAPLLDVRKQFRFEDGAGLQVGTFRVRSVVSEGAGQYRIYIFDLNFAANKSWSDAVKAAYTDADNKWTADLSSKMLFDSTRTAMLWPLPYTGVATLKNNGQTDTSYKIVRSFTVTTNSSGVAVLNLGSNEVFEAVNDLNFIIARTGAASAGTQYTPSAVATASGSPAGRSLTINLGAGNGSVALRVIAPVIKTAIEKSKTKAQFSETIMFNASGAANLTKVDVTKVTSIIGQTTGSELVDYVTLDNGQRAAWYQPGSLQIKNAFRPTEAFTVTYEYYQHGAGDYFSVDSYVDVARSNIGHFNLNGTDVSLADCIDFRPARSMTDFNSPDVYGDIPKTDDNIWVDLYRYLPRVDTVYVTTAGGFGVERGVPSDNPAAPKEPENTLRLYELYVPAYTEDAEKISVNEIDNRRYTMRDIGKLEKRINNIEYYTSLSLLETSVNNIQVIDPVTGNDRFKNGFAVDGFKDIKLGDPSNKEHHGMYNLAAGDFVPEVIQNADDFVLTDGVGHSKVGDIITLAFAEETLINQPLATRTINVNPYAVFTWRGVLGLTPASDFWKDVIYAAPRYVNVTVDNTNGVLPGSSAITQTITTDGVTSWTRVGGTIVTLGGQTSTTSTTTTTRELQESWSQSVSDNAIASQVIPYMRSIGIRWVIQAMRPFTRIYPFWDGVSVSAECAQDGKAYGAEIVTDANGYAAGTYWVPNTDAKRFRTGTSLMRFTDTVNDSRASDENLTSAECQFYSGGTLETRQQTVTSTRTLSIATRQTVVVNSVVTVPQDPIAQTFYIDRQGGVFLSSVEVYFSSKAATIPVKLQLRPVENGLPTDQLMPFGEIVKNPVDVSVSADGTVPTKFTFKEPVYLDPNREYAVVLLADTQDYNVYIAQMGEKVIGQNVVVAKQPHMGVFLTSANGMTWTPNQIQDMKFKLNVCKFTSTTATVNFNLKAPSEVYPVREYGVVTTSGSNLVKIQSPSHGFRQGDSATVSGLEGGNGVTAAQLNKTHVVTSSALDWFEVNVGTAATATGNTGGTEGRVLSAHPYSDMFVNMEHLLLSTTGITWEMRYRQQSNRNYTDWYKIDVKRDMHLPFEGINRVGAIGDVQLRATLTTGNEYLSPVIDMMMASAVLSSYRVNNDVANPVYQYVTRDVMFDNPSTSARFFVGVTLPGSSYLKLYYKLITEADKGSSTVAWKELSPTKPITNSNSPTEYEYQIAGTSSFLGYRVKIAMLSDDAVNYPTLGDFRSIALA